MTRIYTRCNGAPVTMVGLYRERHAQHVARHVREHLVPAADGTYVLIPEPGCLECVEDAVRLAVGNH